MAESGNVPELAEASEQGGGVSLLTLGALGVVFGDIGTSPLYAFKAAFGETLFKGSHQIARAEEISHVMGTLSLFLWSILIVICLKYVVLRCERTTTAKVGFCYVQPPSLQAIKDRGYSRSSGIASKGPLAPWSSQPPCLRRRRHHARHLSSRRRGDQFAAGGTCRKGVARRGRCRAGCPVHVAEIRYHRSVDCSAP